MRGDDIGPIGAWSLAWIAVVMPVAVVYLTGEGGPAQWGRVAAVAVVAAAGTGVAVWVPSRWRPASWPTAPVATAIAVGTAAVVAYGRVDGALARLGSERLVVSRVVWVVLAAASVAGAVAVVRRRPSRVLPVVAIAAGVAAWAPAGAVTGARFADDLVDRFDAHEDELAALVDPAALAGGPNVYVFNLDGYARLDQFQRLTGDEGGWLETGLADRGFAVGDDVDANYPLTFLSMAALFDGGYPAVDADDLRGGVAPFSSLLRGEGAAVDVLRDAGYTYLHAEPGTFLFSRCPDDPGRGTCIPAGTLDGTRLTDRDWALLSATPLRDAVDWFRGRVTVTEGFTDPADVVDGVERHLDAEPFVLFAHVHQPHPPQRYGPTCEPLRPTGGPVWRVDDIGKWADESRCVADQMLAAVDRILARDPDAVIVVLSDHGPAFGIDWSADLTAWSVDEFDERFGVLFAMRTPTPCADAGAVSSLVNTFRVIFTCLGQPVPGVEDRFFNRRPTPFINLVEVEPPLGGVG